MGRFIQKQKDRDNDSLLNAVNDDGKFDSVKEVLNMLQGKDGKKAFNTLVNEVITAALGDDGAIKDAITSAITSALGESGVINTAISGAISTAIGEGGSIETWADGRYEPKSE